MCARGDLTRKGASKWVDVVSFGTTRRHFSESVLKGHGFSRAVKHRIFIAALAAEGRQFSNCIPLPKLPES